MTRRLFFAAVAFFAFAMTLSEGSVAADEAEHRSIKVHCDAPATNYQIEIESVWLVGEQLWVVSQISKVGDIGGAAITPIQDTVKVDAKDQLPVKHFISGKTWNWWQGVACEFIDSRAALLKRMKKDGITIDAVLHGPDPKPDKDDA